ncbi:MAG TPA: hypothetical protein DD670_07985 [Planctomycetaceae bacterium]|nr:hypothetical protein [Planctomycetaceae bacterium]
MSPRGATSATRRPAISRRCAMRPAGDIVTQAVCRRETSAWAAVDGVAEMPIDLDSRHWGVYSSAYRCGLCAGDRPTEGGRRRR